jgi:pilus assembly protein Flp/PilA
LPAHSAGDLAGRVETDRREVIPVMQSIYALISLVRRDEEGQGLAEYALILALIAIVAIIALIFLGGQIQNLLSDVGTSI